MLDDFLDYAINKKKYKVVTLSELILKEHEKNKTVTYM